ncbi:MAG: 30S ribosomal protein S17 [Chloroflexi bacterium]|nr:30S ribosomal protein S17 [Chloroflexota bacterium]
MKKSGRKSHVGRVIGDRMQKTVVVAVEWAQRHRIYGKAVRRITRYYVHADEGQCKMGDMVRIEAARPLSRLKRWRVVEVVSKREVVSIAPEEIGREVEELTMGAKAEGEPEGVAAPEATEGVQADQREVDSP